MDDPARRPAGGWRRDVDRWALDHPVRVGLGVGCTVAVGWFVLLGLTDWFVVTRVVAAVAAGVTFGSLQSSRLATRDARRRGIDLGNSGTDGGSPSGSEEGTDPFDNPDEGG